MWIAIAVDLLGYAVLGTGIYLFGRRRFPAPWNEAGTIIPLVLLFGAFVTMVTFPHWRVFHQ
jgi:hypothetical protein